MRQTWDGRLGDKVAIVTGGAGGLGGAVANRLAAEGASVMVTDVLDDEGRRVADELGEGAQYLRHDVTSEADWRRVVDQTEAAFGPVSILVNTAAVIRWDTPIEETTEAEFRRVLDVNVVGVFLGMRASLPSMRAAGGGSIINFSSTAGLTGAVGLSSYVASKWAVRGLTKTAALEMGEWGIRVNSVHPGRFDTPMTAGLPLPVDQPIRGAGDADDLAGLVSFLASDEARYSTGGEFVMDGGQTAGRMKRLGQRPGVTS